MTRTQRIALVAAALAVAVVAFVVLQPGDDDEGAESAAPPPAQTETRAGQTETTDAEEPPPPPEPEVTRIRIRGGSVAGGVKDIEVERGDTVRIIVAADAQDEIHLHGYDITRNAAPGQPARFRFKANLEGVFEVESHVAEDAGKEPLVARLVVQPS